MTKTILDDEPIIYLYHRKILIAQTTKLEGYEPIRTGWSAWSG